jgi:hypothetical protein
MPVTSLNDLREELGIAPANSRGPVIAAAREQARILPAGEAAIYLERDQYQPTASQPAH